MNKQEITNHLKTERDLLIDWYKKASIQKFESGPEESWSAGQHLYHLLKSTKPLAVGLRMPKIALKLKFGSLKRPSLSFDALKERYKNALLNGAQATGPYVPRNIRNNEKQQLIKRFDESVEALVRVLQKWNEKQLDSQKLMHPVLGELSVREMLYFTVFHTEHHRKILESRYES